MQMLWMQWTHHKFYRIWSQLCQWWCCVLYCWFSLLFCSCRHATESSIFFLVYLSISHLLHLICIFVHIYPVSIARVFPPPILGSRHFNSFLYHHFSHCIYLSLAFNLLEPRGIDYPSMTRDLFKNQLNLRLLSWSLFTLGVCALYIVFESFLWLNLIIEIHRQAFPFGILSFRPGYVVFVYFLFRGTLDVVAVSFFFLYTKGKIFFCLVDGCLIIGSISRMF